MATRTRDSLKLPTSNRAYLIKIDVGPGNRNLILPEFAAAQEILSVQVFGNCHRRFSHAPWKWTASAALTSGPLAWV